jgi:hypothetical protein
LAVVFLVAAFLAVTGLAVTGLAVAFFATALRLGAAFFALVFAFGVAFEAVALVPVVDVFFTVFSAMMILLAFMLRFGSRYVCGYVEHYARNN